MNVRNKKCFNFHNLFINTVFRDIKYLDKLTGFL
jgi:hypothetical protein